MFMPMLGLGQGGSIGTSSVLPSDAPQDNESFREGYSFRLAI